MLPERTRTVASSKVGPGVLLQVDVKGRPVLLGRLRSGEVFATDPDCPHEGAALIDGEIRGGAVDCPRHHYLFDALTGDNLYPLPIYPQWKRDQVGDLHLGTFRCQEEAGWIWIQLTDSASA